MKKYIKLLFGLLIFTICFSFQDTFAAGLPSIIVGNKEIHLGETKNIYGGTVSFADGEITLNNVNVTDTYHGTIYGSSDGYFSIYAPLDTVNLKLVGNNTITSNYTDGGFGSHYYGIGIDDTDETNLNISGDGTLTFNVSNYCYFNVLYAWNTKIGSSSTDQGPTLNFNVVLSKDEFNEGSIMGEVQSILKSNININVVKANEVDLILFQENANIVKSNFNIYLNSWGLSRAFVVQDNVSLKSNNIVTKIDFDDSYDSSNKEHNYVFYSGAFPGKTFRLLNGNSYFEAPSICSEYTTMEVGPYEGNIDAFFAGKFNGSLVLDNSFWPSPANLRYTSKTTKNALVNTYDEDDLNDYKYIRITDNSINYSLLEGNNQKLKELNEFKFKVSGVRELLENIMLDDVVLSNDDYTYDDEGVISFTSSGLNKIKALSDGSHKVYVNYYNNNSIEVDFDYTGIKEVNPPTIDKIVYYLIGLVVSMIGMISIIVISKKKNI